MRRRPDQRQTDLFDFSITHRAKAMAQDLASRTGITLAAYLPAIAATPAPRQKRPKDTHREACRQLTARSYATARQRVLDAIEAAGPAGATDEQIGDATCLDGNTLRPRRLELKREGLIADSGQERLTRSGRDATVWVAIRYISNPISGEQGAGQAVTNKER